MWSIMITWNEMFQFQISAYGFRKFFHNEIYSIELTFEICFSNVNRNYPFFSESLLWEERITVVVDSNIKNNEGNTSKCCLWICFVPWKRLIENVMVDVTNYSVSEIASMCVIVIKPLIIRWSRECWSSFVRVHYFHVESQFYMFTNRQRTL